MVDHQDFSNDTNGRLARLATGSLELIRLVGSALSEAITALFDAGMPVEHSRPVFDELLLALREDLESHSAAVLAGVDDRVAGDVLRQIVVGVQVNTDVECLGELARSIADVARSRRGKPPLPAGLDAVVREMGHDCLTMVDTLVASINSGRPSPARELDQAYDAVSGSLWELYRGLVAHGEAVDVRTGIDVCLVGRCLSRTAGHTLSLARHLMFLDDRSPTE